MSKAAWGALQKKGTQLCLRHYEMGVLFLPSMVQQPTFKCMAMSNDEDQSHCVPVPYSLPLKTFSHEGENQPWVFDKSYTSVDHLGKKYGHARRSE